MIIRYIQPTIRSCVKHFLKILKMASFTSNLRKPIMIILLIDVMATINAPLLKNLPKTLFYGDCVKIMSGICIVEYEIPVRCPEGAIINYKKSDKLPKYIHKYFQDKIFYHLEFPENLRSSKDYCRTLGNDNNCESALKDFQTEEENFQNTPTFKNYVFNEIKLSTLSENNYAKSYLTYISQEASLREYYEDPENDETIARKPQNPLPYCNNMSLV